MSERKKKTGDVVAWAVIDKHKVSGLPFYIRSEARRMAAIWNEQYPADRPHRIAKVVLAK